MERRVYVYTADALSMAKLYWRIKKDGKWTWTPANYILHYGECKLPDMEKVTLFMPKGGE